MEVDTSSAESVAAGIIVLAAHEQFEQACEHASNDFEDCLADLEAAHTRWAADAGYPSRLEQARGVTAEDFWPTNAGLTELDNLPGFSYDGTHWKPTYSDDSDGPIQLSTYYLGDASR
ncbi:hypothetical protein [Pseudactinotalea sp. Z1748]|uniref:hypothetical protein n=1 Tax=Pseudactinotalea sp. Z1748 TaxID=3413027 RepID=UPI003C7B9B47